MQTKLIRAMLLSAPAMLSIAAVAWSQDYTPIPTPAYGQANAPSVYGSPAAPPASTASTYTAGTEYRYPGAALRSAPTPAVETADSSRPCDDDDLSIGCQRGPARGLVLFNEADSWRGRPDGSYPNNDGIASGFNYGSRMGRVSDWTGLGFQFGASYGVFDWNGRSSNANNIAGAQTQVFVTTGVFKKLSDHSNWSYGLVHDWMINRNFGTEGTNPTLGQWRGQISYAMNPWNEIGVWATLRDLGMTRFSDANGPVAYRAIDQGNMFWHHKYRFGGDSWIWLGIPQENRLGDNGSLGNFIVGGNVSSPLNDYVSVYANMQYMHPSAAAGPQGSTESSWYVGAGLSYTIGGWARSRTVAGNGWLPLMGVANNGTFLVDSSIAQ